MKALTLRQPWASAVMYGPKDWENRVWVPGWMIDALNKGYPPPRVWIGLHAGKAWACAKRELDEELEDLRFDWPAAPPAPDYPLGCLLGAVEIVGAVRCPALGQLLPWQIRQPAGRPSWCWKIGNVAPLPEPIPMAGRQGLWNLPEPHVAKLRGAYANRFGGS